jgi:uncharacterized protein YndB with AHSA1/START domain
VHVESSIDIDAEPERVWAVMTNVERWPEWTPTVKEVELLQPGPLAVGSEARIAQPRVGTWKWRVTALDPGSSFAWEASRPGTQMVATHTVTPRAGGGSSVVLSVDSGGWAVRLLGWALAGTARRFVQTEAEGLKRRSEETARTA